MTTSGDWTQIFGILYIFLWVDLKTDFLIVQIFVLYHGIKYTLLAPQFLELAVFIKFFTILRLDGQGIIKSSLQVKNISSLKILKNI